MFLEKADAAFDASTKIHIVSPVLMGTDGDRINLDQTPSGILALDAHLFDGRAERDDHSGT